MIRTLKKTLRRLSGRPQEAPPAATIDPVIPISMEAEPGLLPGHPPVPSISLRRSVGIEDRAFFENPQGLLTFQEDVPPEHYHEVLDFGCGCGRIARQLMLQETNVPARYLGVDLYERSINWCRTYLTPHAPQFEFQHLDIFNPGLNPKGSKRVGIGAEQPFTLVNAHSVFTHILEDDLEFYFNECIRLLADGGTLRATWFLFDKKHFPMMQDFQNCLYVNLRDPSNATIYDVEFVKALYQKAGLYMYSIYRPYIRGHQWLVYARKGVGEHIPFPPDDGPIGLTRPPVAQ